MWVLRMVFEHLWFAFCNLSQSPSVSRYISKCSKSRSIMLFRWLFKPLMRAATHGPMVLDRVCAHAEKLFLSKT